MCCIPGTFPEGFVGDVKRAVAIGPVAGHQILDPTFQELATKPQFIINHALMQEE